IPSLARGRWRSRVFPLRSITDRSTRMKSILSLFLLGAAIAAAQDSRSMNAPTGPAPRLSNGKPDFSGVWQPPRMADITRDEPCCKGMKDLPFTPWGKQQWEAYHAEEGDYAGSCMPFGRMRSVGGPHPAQIVQNDKYIAFLYEQNTWFSVT